jgi:hypothetical protein
MTHNIMFGTYGHKLCFFAMLIVVLRILYGHKLLDQVK